MCTATWLITEDGYELFFNRDELKSRAIAVPPTIKRQQAARFIAPEDADAGGTWIGVNEFGFTACLLNYYPGSGSTFAKSEPAERLSRGHVVVSVMASQSVSKALDTLSGLDYGRYMPFSLLLFSPGGSPARLRWRGAGEPGLSKTPSMPQSSSSFQTTAVVSSRKDLFAEEYGAIDTESLALYHRSHQPERGPYSVCMHRDDAETQSFSRVVVEPASVAFEYVPGSPCDTEPMARITLERRA